MIPTSLHPNSSIVSANFTFELSTTPLPWSTLFSSAPEVQQVLASFPLLAVGLVGTAFAAFQLSISRVNRAFIDLFIACGLALVGGVLQIFAALRAEYLGQQRASRGLQIAQGIVLASFLTFKLFFLYRRSAQTSIYRPPMLQILPPPLSRTASPLDGGARWSFAPPASARSGGAIRLPSGSRERWGVLGDVVRVASWVAIIVTGVTDSVWRSSLGMRRARFRGSYIASNSFQLVLLLFFASKIIHSTSANDSLPRRRTFLGVAPLLLGIVLAMVVAVVSLVPSLRTFSETPLGRFLLLTEMYIWILEMVILDFRRPIRDSFSLDKPAARPHLPRKTSFASIPEQVDHRSFEGDVEGKPSPSTPALPAGIVIRRGSRVPSWFRSRSALAKERDMKEQRNAEDEEEGEDSLTAGAAPHGEVVMSTLAAEERSLEASRRWAAGEIEEEMRPPRFPESVRGSDSSGGYRVEKEDRLASPSESGLVIGHLEAVDEEGGVRLFGAGAGAVPSTWTTRPPSFADHSPKPSNSSVFHDLRFSRLDSADLDLDFAIQHDVFQRHRELDAGLAPGFASPRESRLSSTILPSQRPPPPADTPMPPIPAFPPSHSREASGTTIRITKPRHPPSSLSPHLRDSSASTPPSTAASSKPTELVLIAEQLETPKRREIPAARSQRPTIHQAGGSDITLSYSPTSTSPSDPASPPDRLSSNSLATNTSSLSLSHFPQPPSTLTRHQSAPISPSEDGSSTPTPISPISVTTRPATPNLSRQASRQTRTSSRRQVVTQDGSEFELLPPPALSANRREGGKSSARAEGRPSFDSDAVLADARSSQGLQVEGGQGLDITSLIVSEECKVAAERLRRELAGRDLSTEQSEVAKSSASVTESVDLEDEEESLEMVVEAATVRSRPTVQTRSRGAITEQPQAQTFALVRQDSKLRVDEPGRIIPTRPDQDGARHRNAIAMGQLGSITSPTSGLPSNPRRGAPRPHPIVPAPYLRPFNFPEDTPSTPSPASTVSVSTLDNLRQRPLGEGSDSDSPATSEATYDPFRPFEMPRAPPKAPRKPQPAARHHRGAKLGRARSDERFQEGIAGEERKGQAGGRDMRKASERGGTRTLVAKMVSRVGGGAG